MFIRSQQPLDSVQSVTPWDRYQQDLTEDDFTFDPAQERVMRRLQQVYDELQCAEQSPKSVFDRVSQLFSRTPAAAPKGVYIWGSVGRGKTYLMDCLYDLLPLERKVRLHFHRFMDKVHGELGELGNRADPLDIVADRFAEEARLLCFDEFFVSDIGDAMILSGLLEGLFNRGVVLVATSNVTPDRLYWDGLQRAQFLPAIDLIKRHTDVMELGGSDDYRLRILEQAELYYHPADDEAESQLRECFTRIAPGAIEQDRQLTVNHRLISAVAAADGVAWFTYGALCLTPRSAADYVELARRFNTVVLQDVPVMDDEDNNGARRFISLIDELYDRNVTLIMSAAAPLLALYKGRRLEFEFQRTTSRLTEMQSHEFLAREHLP